ncbi:hypothetical protein ACJX0J_025186, partial [Zea mays]
RGSICDGDIGQFSLLKKWHTFGYRERFHIWFISLIFIATIRLTGDRLYSFLWYMHWNDQQVVRYCFVLLIPYFYYYYQEERDILGINFREVKHKVFNQDLVHDYSPNWIGFLVIVSQTKSKSALALGIMMKVQPTTTKIVTLDQCACFYNILLFRLAFLEGLLYHIFHMEYTH